MVDTQIAVWIEPDDVCDVYVNSVGDLVACLGKHYEHSLHFKNGAEEVLIDKIVDAKNPLVPGSEEEG